MIVAAEVDEDDVLFLNDHFHLIFAGSGIRYLLPRRYR